jgi:transcriptional regulator GlxA family with amidase domain
MLPGMTAPAARTVVVAVYDGVDALDVAGPAEVFAIADRMVGDGGYDVVLAAPSAGRVHTFSGLPLLADRDFSAMPPDVDTLLVAGGAVVARTGAVAPVVDDAVVQAVRRYAPGTRRVAGVCTGAHVLAAAGLLDGRRATTHWATAELLRSQHPRVHVDAEPIFVRDGDVWTSAGLTAGVDLALALVADDHGDDLARAVARWLVVYLRRPGGQSQYSVMLRREAAGPGPVRDLQRWMADNLTSDLSVPALAARVSMSVRHFSRVFGQETGSAPAEYVAHLRLEVARRHLEHGQQPLDVVARLCGYGSVDALQRAFRLSGTTAARHRAQFRSASRPQREPVRRG